MENTSGIDWFTFAVRNSWSSQLNASDRSVSNVPKSLLLSTAIFRFFNNYKTQIVKKKYRHLFKHDSLENFGYSGYNDYRSEIYFKILLLFLLYLLT